LNQLYTQTSGITMSLPAGGAGDAGDFVWRAGSLVLAPERLA